MNATATTSEDIVTGYAEDIRTGRAFALAAASHRSRRGYQPVLDRRSWSDVNLSLAKMARDSDALAAVAAKIIGTVNLYGTRPDACARVFDAAREALAEDYVDVVGLSGPEPGRRSDRTRAYTLRERIAVMAWCYVATGPISGGGIGFGWALEELIDGHGIMGLPR